MGKPTGFKEIPREMPKRRSVELRVRDWNEIYNAFADEKLRAQVPDGVLELLRVPGVGPRTVRTLHETLGIDSLEALRAAAESGGLRHVKGLSERTEQNILEGIARIELRSGNTRLLIHDADALIAGLVKAPSTYAPTASAERALANTRSWARKCTGRSLTSFPAAGPTTESSKPRCAQASRIASR